MTNPRIGYLVKVFVALIGCATALALAPHTVHAVASIAAGAAFTIAAYGMESYFQEQNDRKARWIEPLWG
ncbi:hypothetical protein [Bradyrhizobium sp. SZCCHNR1045]|uniref:hypothetical protein n=1 Tax=Bradyrhizobium sp. SZCCHNR1045 TaxID=3057353 RepID=UPI00291682D7|nr:hypothetical protein [Bradyrhizobium sp. SZCCHNR1045]